MEIGSHEQLVSANDVYSESIIASLRLDNILNSVIWQEQICNTKNGDVAKSNEKSCDDVTSLFMQS